MEIYVQSSRDSGNKRYTWSQGTGTICRAVEGQPSKGLTNYHRATDIEPP